MPPSSKLRVLLAHVQALLDSLVLGKEGKMRSCTCTSVGVKVRLVGGGW